MWDLSETFIQNISDTSPKNNGHNYYFIFVETLEISSSATQKIVVTLSGYQNLKGALFNILDGYFLFFPPPHHREILIGVKNVPVVVTGKVSDGSVAPVTVLGAHDLE